MFSINIIWNLHLQWIVYYINPNSSFVMKLCTKSLFDYLLIIYLTLWFIFHPNSFGFHFFCFFHMIYGTNCNKFAIYFHLIFMVNNSIWFIVFLSALIITFHLIKNSQYEPSLWGRPNRWKSFNIIKTCWCWWWVFSFTQITLSMFSYICTKHQERINLLHRRK